MGPPPTWRGWFGARWWPSGQAKWPASRVERPPLPRGSPPRVDGWQPRLRQNHLKPELADQGVGLASQPLGPLGLGSGSLGPHVKYTPMVMLILTFGQLHFVIP
jgi:hypothetical protein